MFKKYIFKGIEKLLKFFYGKNIKYGFLKAAIYDASLCSEHFFDSDIEGNDTETLFCRAVMLAHGIEKGLSFKKRKTPFFVSKLPLFLELLDVLIIRDPQLEDSRWVMITNSLRAYDQVHSTKDFFSQYSARVNGLLKQKVSVAQNSPVKDVLIDFPIYRSYSDFFKSRTSIRNFSEKHVSEELIYEAVNIAKFTPSVCNRQPWKIKILSSKNEKKIALDYQNGNAGFGYQADKIVIIGADLRSFVSIIERNECFIDLGMFSMSLILALKEQGLGSCCLNWCVATQVDEQLHEELDLPDWFKIGYLLAVGYPEENTMTATSPRRDTSDFFI